MFDEVLFDIETDGLLNVCTRIWIVCITDLKTGETKEFLEGDLGWQEILSNAKLVVGHHILGFDLEVFKKFYNYTLSETTEVLDTLILSQVLNYRRFGSEGHSLEAWGKHLNEPKQEHDDWSQFSEAMAERCRSDVRLNVKVYRILKAELNNLKPKAPNLIRYIYSENAATEWCAEAERQGWPFDMEKAKKLQSELQETIDIAHKALSDTLGTKTVAVDLKKGIVETKKPKWTKQGFYDAHTSNWFGIDPCSGFEGEERLVEGPYSRIAFKELSLDSVADVKIFLFRHNWIPLEYNSKIDPISNKKVRTSPKITEESLEFLGGNGKLYANFAIARSRLAILKSWITLAEIDGKVHGECMVIGTSSMRARHSIIVNVPSVDSAWGKEMRELFIAEPGWKLVGADSAGNQARGFAHFLNNKHYIDTLVHGDVHTYNAQILEMVLDELDISWDDYLKSISITGDEATKRKRANAKRILYAFLFGAGGPKLWSYIFNVPNETKGKKLKAGFTKAVPGYKALLDRLENIYGKTSQYSDQGYIPSVVGNRIYCDSFHKLLVYLLQATEKATCSASLMLTVKGLKEAKIPYKPKIFMHDEIQFTTPEEYSQQAAVISKQAFIDGPKLLGITIMDGESKIGDTWYDTH